MTSSENGRWNNSTNSFIWWETLYYDDISHNGFVHNAYFLRFFEHAREHMLHEQYLADVIEKEEKMFVAVSTEQKQNFNNEVINFSRVGNYIKIETKVQVDGKYRIRFCHEAFLFSKISNDIAEGVQLCKGHVDMVCVHPTNHRIKTLPDSLFDTISEIKAIPKQHPIKIRALPSVSCEFEALSWRVADYDTDFTKVVYQAKYLQYYELCRKINLGKFCETSSGQTLFCVFKATVKFKSPATPDQALSVEVKSVKQDGKFKLIFEQHIVDSITRNVINEALVELIQIDANTKKLLEIKQIKF